MRVLAGDIGGTKTLLQVAEIKDNSHQSLLEERYSSQDFPGLGAMAQAFLARAKEAGLDDIHRACFAIAGPIRQQSDRQTVRTTNLPWELDSRALMEYLGLDRVQFINDFAGIGHGIDVLAPEELSPLQAGQGVAQAPRLVVGAGTGLGVCQLVWVDGHYRALGSEGGHIGFSPANRLEADLWHYLNERYGRVSWERLVSGPGLVNIYTFLRHRQVQGAPPLEEGDPAAAITEASRRGDDSVAQEALQLFVQLYGRFAGDLALVSLPYGGIFIAGGIAPKLVPELSQGPFITAFADKGRMASLARSIPVHIVLDTQVGLRGAALAATRDH